MDTKNIINLRIFDREIIQSIKKWIDDKEIILLLGARQTGKTSVLYKLIQDLINTEKAKIEDIYFFDAENINHFLIMSRGIEEITRIVKPEQGKRKYIFLDEIHYVKNIDRTLKLLVDHYSDFYKIIATGSSSLEIKNKFRQSMTGRKIIFEIYPLSFYEYLVFSGKDILADLLKDRNQLQGNFDIAEEFCRQLKLEYENYIVYGGYPRVVLESDAEKKKMILNEIYTAYIRKDVEAFFRVDDIEKFNNLIKYIAVNSGQIFNKNSASKYLSIAGKTINRYLNILSLSYIIGIIRPFYKNKTKEILKMPKIYFFDNGIRNAIMNNYNNLEARTDAGVCIETAAYSYLVNKYRKREEIKYWRTKTGNEIDFIIDGEKLYAIECKKSITSFSEAKYADFIKTYKPEKFFVLNMEKDEVKKTIYIPLWKLG